MNEGPEVRVRSAQLDEGVPVALRDNAAVFDLMIDFRHPPAAIASGLQALFRESVGTGRWQRQASTLGGPAVQAPQLEPDLGPDSESPDPPGPNPAS